MNFRTLPTDELVTFLLNETNHQKFISATKEFITRYLSQKHFNQEEVNKLVEEARDEGVDLGYDEARKAYNAMMDEFINTN